jgi:hypothetical protein
VFARRMGKSRDVLAADETPAAPGSRVNAPDGAALDQRRIAAVVAASRWRSPGADLRREVELERAVLVLERTAACVDLVLERLAEVAASLDIGRREQTYLMRGLMTGRIEDLLESLEAVVTMAAHDGVNLLGPGNTPFRVRLEAGDFNYTLAPICVLRDRRGLDIAPLQSAFEDDAEALRILQAVRRAIRRLELFAARLTSDADVIIALVRDHQKRRAMLQQEAAMQSAALEALRAAPEIEATTGADPA